MLAPTFRLFYPLYATLFFLVGLRYFFRTREGRHLKKSLTACALLVLPIFIYYGAWIPLSGGSLVTVPHVEGMSREQAIQELENAGLKAELPQGGPEEYEGRVAHQNPVAGMRTHQGRSVTLEFPARTPWVLVPSLVGKSPLDVDKELRGMGLQMTGVNPSSTSPIIFQYPAPGIRLERGATVEVGDGTAPSPTGTAAP